MAGRTLGARAPLHQRWSPLGVVEPAPDNQATLLLRRWAEGDAQAGEELAPLVYDELKRPATAHLARRSGAHTLQPTALVNEAWMRLMRSEQADYPSRGHFYALASSAMRTLLVDHARRKNSEKRGGRATLIMLEEDRDPAKGDSGVDVLAIHEALGRLAAMDAELGRLVELRFFGGLDMETAATTLGLTKRTAERRWRVASAWLAEQLEND